MTYHRIAPALVLLAAAACAEPEPETLCVPNSGDTELVFGAAVIGVISGDDYPFYFSEVGASYLYIDGECRWWANPSVSDLQETRTGVLSSAQAESIAVEVDYREWLNLDGLLVFNAGASHYAEVGFYRPGASFTCTGGCGWSDAVYAITNDLWADSDESLAGGIWAWRDASIAPQNNADLGGAWTIYDWPFSVDYGAFMAEVEAVDPADRHPGYLETDPNALALLRTLRRDHDRETDGHSMRFAINDSQSVTVHIRDALPIENELGFLDGVW